MNNNKFAKAAILIAAIIVIVFSILVVLSSGIDSLWSGISSKLNFSLITFAFTTVLSIVLTRKNTREKLLNSTGISKRLGVVLLVAGALSIPMPFISAIFIGINPFNLVLLYKGMSGIQQLVWILQENHILTILTFVPFAIYLIKKYNVQVAAISIFFVVGLSEFYVAPVIMAYYHVDIYWWIWYIPFAMMVFPFYILLIKKKITLDKRFWIYFLCTYWIEWSVMIFPNMFESPIFWDYSKHAFAGSPLLLTRGWSTGLTAVSVLGIIRRIKDGFTLVFIKRR